MKGKILDYSLRESKGLISGDDGKRYEFQNSEWRSDKMPTKNQIVDFEIDGSYAKGIYIESSPIINTDDIKDKINQIKNSDTLKNVQTNIKESFWQQIENKFGFVISVLAALATFLPIASLYGLDNKLAIEVALGQWILIFTIVSAILFYKGVKRVYIKIITTLSAVSIIVTQLLFMINLNNGGFNPIKLLSFGFYFLLILAVLLILAGYKMAYNEKNQQ